MHETSLIQALFKQVADVVQGYPRSSVESIRVEIGPLSGVEPLLIASAFDRLVGDSACRGAVLRIEQVELSAQCSNCGVEFVIRQFQFICPSCGSMRINVTRGDEFRLLDVTISDDDVLLANENGGLAAPCGNLGGDR